MLHIRLQLESIYVSPERIPPKVTKHFHWNYWVRDAEAYTNILSSLAGGTVHTILLLLVESPFPFLMLLY